MFPRQWYIPFEQQTSGNVTQSTYLADPVAAGAATEIPISASTFGLGSSLASRAWHELQSCETFAPAVETWLSSWQRKQPGKSVWPRLFGYPPHCTRISGKTFRR